MFVEPRYIVSEVGGFWVKFTRDCELLCALIDWVCISQPKLRDVCIRLASCVVLLGAKAC